VSVPSFHIQNLKVRKNMSVFDLWLPILVTGIVTHVYSMLAWTVLPHHKPEWNKIPDEDAAYPTLEKIPPGQYVFPHASCQKDMQAESFKRKLGIRNGMLVIWTGPTQMGKAIGQTFITYFVIAFLIGYLASIGVSRGAEFVKVVQFATTAGLLAHIAAKFPFVFWFRRRIIMDVLDGVIFAVLTGVIFAALWPK
jgi:hypothetical protein